VPRHQRQPIGPALGRLPQRRADGVLDQGSSTGPLAYDGAFIA
jgi:hypothetical protein